jgi:hypothetical protein
MDLTTFWNQLFYPTNNFIEIFFAIFMSLFTQRLTEEMEKGNVLELPNPSNLTGTKISNYILRVVISFIIVLLITIGLIVIISLLMALYGFIIALR